MTPPFSWADGGQVPAAIPTVFSKLAPWMATNAGVDLGPYMNWQSMKISMRLNAPTIATLEFDMNDPFYQYLSPTLNTRLKLMESNALRFYMLPMIDTISEDAARGIATISYGDPRIQWNDIYIPGASNAPHGPVFTAATTIAQTFRNCLLQCTSNTMTGGTMASGLRTMVYSTSGTAPANTMGYAGAIERGRSLADVVAELCELGMDCNWTSVDGYVSWPPPDPQSWVMGGPFINDVAGVVSPTSHFTYVDNSIDGLPGGLVSNCENMKRTWSKVFTAANYTGTDTVTGAASKQTYLDATAAAAYERVESWESSANGITAAQMLQRATQKVLARNAPIPIIEVINPNRLAPQPLFSLNLGWTVNVTCQAAGINLFNQPYRVHGMDWEFTSEGVNKGYKVLLADL